MIVGRRRGDGFARRARIHQLLAQVGILSARQAGHGFAGAANPLLHGVSLLAAQQLRAFQPAYRVQVVAIDEILGRLGCTVVEVAPGADQVAAVGLSQAGVNLRP